MLKVIVALLLLAIGGLCGLILFSHLAQQQVYDFCNELYSGLPVEELQQLASQSDMQQDQELSKENLIVYTTASPIAFWEKHTCQINQNNDQIVSLELVTY